MSYVKNMIQDVIEAYASGIDVMEIGAKYNISEETVIQIIEDYYLNKQEYFDYLDNLRESGVTNMFGAASYLVSEFGINKKDAKDILLEWMESFER